MKPRLHVAMIHAAHDRSGSGSGIWSFALRFAIGHAIPISARSTPQWSRDEAGRLLAAGAGFRWSGMSQTSAELRFGLSRDSIATSDQIRSTVFGFDLGFLRDEDAAAVRHILPAMDSLDSIMGAENLPAAIVKTLRPHQAIVATAPDRLSCYGFAAEPLTIDDVAEELRAAVRQTTIGGAWLAQLDAAKNASTDTDATSQGEAA